MGLGLGERIRLLKQRFFPGHDEATAPEYLNGESLSAFLLDCKQQYLAAVADGKAKEWIVVMGNEAGGMRFLCIAAWSPKQE